MFERAKMLAARSKSVTYFIVSYTLEPSLLYYSLSNEIKTCNLKVKDHLKVVMCTGPSDIKKQIAGKSNLHVFIDEMIWDKYAYQEFNELMEDISPDTYLWAAIGRIKSVDVIKVKEMMVEKYGFHIPNLSHALRNSKQIIDYDSAYKKSKQIIEYDSAYKKSSYYAKPISNNVNWGRYRLATEGWPCSAAMKVTIQSNQTYGPTPIQIVRKGSLDENIAECFQHFPTSGGKILVIIYLPSFHAQIERDIFVSHLKEIVKTVRSCSPLVAIRKSYYDHLDEETRTAVKEWVENRNKQPQDLIVDKTFIGGFEWPSVLILNFGNLSSENLFHERNCIMRAMSRLVILD